jgi:hypothetical protein
LTGCGGDWDEGGRVEGVEAEGGEVEGGEVEGGEVEGGEVAGGEVEGGGDWLVCSGVASTQRLVCSCSSTCSAGDGTERSGGEATEGVAVSASP